MKTTIKPFIEIMDAEYMDNFSIGYHQHQPKLNIDEVRIGYPICQDFDAVRRYHPNFKDVTVSKLMHYIRDIILMECAEGNNYAPHNPSDYCIEIIDIENGIATISIGS